MDNLTHSLIGVALSRGGLNRVTPHATAILLLAVNLPDLDIVSLAGGELTYLDLHHSLTHGFATAPLLAVLPVLLFRYGLRKPVPWLGGWLISLVGIMSHLGLDFVTAYGIRLASPFSATWYQWPVLSNFDAVLFLILLLAIAGPALSKLVAGEIGAKPSSGRGWAIFALIFALGWIGGRGVLHARAEQMLTSRVQQGTTPRRVMALPTAFSPFKWRGLVETEGFFAVHEMNVLFDFDPEQGLLLRKPQQVEVVQAAQRTPSLQRFLGFAQWPVWRIVPMDEPPGAQRVQVFDLRFSDDGTAFKAVVEVDAAGRILRETFHIRP